MATTQSHASQDWRAFLYLTLRDANKLNDEFLPPEEFLIVQSKAYSDWPAALQTKLAPYGAALIKGADQQAT